MTLIELQKSIAARLNSDAILMQGGCKAFAEDSLSAEADVASQLQEACAVALVVLTPSVSRAGGFRSDGIPVQVDELVVEALEKPGANRSRTGAMTALEAAQRAALALDSDSLEFKSLRQEVDAASGILTAAAVFGTSFFLH